MRSKIYGTDPIHLQILQESSSPHAQVQLHDVKVEGQWKRVKGDSYNPVPISALPSGPYGQQIDLPRRI